MVALYVQTLLMLAAAYFVGAALACLIRRALSIGSRQTVPAKRSVDPLPEAVQQAGGARFGRPQFEPPRPAPAPPPLPAPAAARPATTQPAEDLKRIALIDGALEAGLNKLGVTRYDQIAAWLKADVQRVSKALAIGGDRINRENWIEQAQVLAKGGETYYAKRRARGEAANAEPTADEGERRAAPAPAPRPAAQTPRPSTRGAAAVAAEIAVANVAQASSPATPQPPPVDTTPADVAGRAAFAVERAPVTQASGLSGAPTAGAMPEAAVPVRPGPAPTRDNLQRISGIDSEVEQLLAANGVSRYGDIAQWSPADVARFDRLFGGRGRIQRENWVEQAQILSRGGDTAFSRNYDRNAGADASGAPPPAAPSRAAAVPEASSGPPSTPNLGSLRSVRGQDWSEEPGPEAALRAATQNKIFRAQEGSSDLKRIRGIGVLIERKLNSMGVTSYEQIANWTAQDIDRVSQQLDFKGRIERENWVEQARILASGGATEFSRRFDSGELETGRYKA
jgi:predicted flap endonuclease-1-like 5' DNA nuclease